MHEAGDPAIDSRPRSYVRVNGVAGIALWDTGSEVTLISASGSLAKKINYNKPLKIPKAKLVAANSSHLSIIGKYRVTFSISSHLFQADVLLVEGLRSPCIIGIDVMTQERYVINPGERTVTRESEDDCKAQAELAAWKVEEVRVSNSVCVESLSSAIVKCKIPGNSRKEVIISEVSEEVAEIGLSTDLGMYSTHSNSFEIEVFNHNPWPVELSKGTGIADASTASQFHAETVEQVLKRAFTSEELHFYEISEVKGPAQIPDLKGIPLKYRDKFIMLLSSFQDVINDDAGDIGKCSVMKQKIRLKDESKIANTPPYRIPPALQPVVDDFIQKLLTAGVIRKSISPFSSPLMLVRKPNADCSKPLMEQYRVVNDFRRLNANTVKDSYPLQNIYQLIDEVANSRVASIIDLRSAFFNQELEEESRKYTSFAVPGRGLFEYCRSPQGLINSSSTFQRLLDKLMEGLKGVRVYVDDIVIFSDTYEQHLHALKQVLIRLRMHNFKCSVKKMHIGCGSVNYLGYEIKPGISVRPGALKCKAIRNWPVPNDVTKIKQFIGLCSFFRRTIPHFSEISAPLTKLTRKDSKYKKGELPYEAYEAFAKLKSKLSSRPCLAPVDFQREFILTTDASNEALGAVLSQKDKNGLEYPCAYYSRSLSDSEKKLAPFHLEHLAMVAACRHFEPYLVGKEFLIRTDHKPLLALNKVQGKSLDRLKLELQEFQPFRISYMRGIDMIADGLSRNADSLQEDEAVVDEIAKMNEPHIKYSQLKEMQQSDVFCKALYCALKYKSYPSDQQLGAKVLKYGPQMLLKEDLVRKRLSDGSSLILAPVRLKFHLLARFHDHPLSGHLGSKKTFERVSQTWWWPDILMDVMDYCKECEVCCRANAALDKKPSELQPFPKVKAPFERVHLDLLQMPLTENGKKYVVVMVDAFTRWCELVSIKDKKARTVAQSVARDWICRHGAPKSFLSDLGSEFTNQVFKEMCEGFHIQMQFATVSHPASNGKAERLNRSIINYMRKYVEPDLQWDEQLAYAQFALNTAFHFSMKTTPYKMIYLNDPHLPQEIVSQERLTLREPSERGAIERMKDAYTMLERENENSYSIYKVQHDKRAKEKKLVVGDRVFLAISANREVGKKLQTPYKGPYFVAELLPKMNVKVRLNNSTKCITVHKDIVKLAPCRKSWVSFDWNTDRDNDSQGRHSGNEEEQASLDKNRDLIMADDEVQGLVVPEAHAEHANYVEPNDPRMPDAMPVMQPVIPPIAQQRVAAPEAVIPPPPLSHRVDERRGQVEPDDPQPARQGLGDGVRESDRPGERSQRTAKTQAKTVIRGEGASGLTGILKHRGGAPSFSRAAYASARGAVSQTLPPTKPKSTPNTRPVTPESEHGTTEGTKKRKQGPEKAGGGGVTRSTRHSGAEAKDFGLPKRF